MQYKVVASPALYPEVQEKIISKDKITYKVLDTYINLEWLMQHFNAEIKHNLMTRRREIIIPGHYLFNDDIENAALAKVNYLSTLNEMPTKQIDQHLEIISHINAYHPIVECLKNNPWDGVNRLDDFLNCIKTNNDKLSRELFKTWMVSALEGAHSIEGFAQQGVLVFQGKQGIGKTRLVKALDPINCNAVKEGAILDPGSKDSIIQICRHWIVELGELDATFQKSAIARLKSFITSSCDDVRFPFAPKSTILPRRTAFIATVNDDKFLSDDTGNRRWWTIPMISISFKEWNMIQIWAEVYKLWEAGKSPYLTEKYEMLVNESNVEHEKIDPLKEKLSSWYDWNSSGRRWMSATSVLEEMYYNNPSRGDATKMGKLLKEKNGKPGKRSADATLHEVPLNVRYRNQ